MADKFKRYGVPVRLENTPIFKEKLEKNNGDGKNSAVFGVTDGEYANKATGDYSFAAGENTEASGRGSTALGSRTKATGIYSFAAGSGDSTAGTYTVAAGDDAVAIGYACEATGNYSSAFGYMAKATGNVSHAVGNNAKASGAMSTAIGDAVKATGARSFAVGSSASFQNTEAKKEGAVAIGRGTVCDAQFGTAIGLGLTTGTVQGQTVLGRYNETPQSAEIFAVGSGRSDASRQTAFAINNDGKAFFVQNVASGSMTKGYDQPTQVNELTRKDYVDSRTERKTQYYGSTTAGYEGYFENIIISATAASSLKVAFAKAVECSVGIILTLQNITTLYFGAASGINEQVLFPGQKKTLLGYVKSTQTSGDKYIVCFYTEQHEYRYLFDFTSTTLSVAFVTAI